MIVAGVDVGSITTEIHMSDTSFVNQKLYIGFFRDIFESNVLF